MSFDTEVCRRLPLADATLHMLDFVADLSFLADLFDRYRGRSYQKQISFADLVYLLADSLVLNGQSAHRTFQQARANGEMSASVKAAYDKIARLPIELSVALLTEGSARLRDLLPESLCEPVPASLAAFTPLGFDGKKIKYVARRLRPLRSVRGQVIGGKILVAEDVRTGLAAAMEADPDGEASDLTLVPGLLTRTRAVVGGPRLWVGDRLFCDLIHLPLLAADGDHFVVRYCGKVKFYPDPERPTKTGANRRGQPYTEEWGWLGGPDDERRLYVRRVTVHRPDDEDVSVVTDLVDGEIYPAADILDMYLRRWGIERLFQKVTEVFHLQALVSARENGTVFQAALCLLLYNLTVVVRAYVAEGAKRTTDDVSMEKLFVDIGRQLTGIVEVLGTPAVVAHYADGTWTAARLRTYLNAVLGGTWRDWWKKSPPRKKTKPTPTEYLKGGHSSVYKIVRGLHETIPDAKPPAKEQQRPSKQ
jgi:Transposase DDE domain